MKYIDSTPLKDDFRMPGEFECHDGCWILWPERTDNWRNGAKPAQKAFVMVAEAISRFEKVTVGVSASQYINARQLLPPQIRVIEISYNDAWVRDCGPTCVVNEAGVARGVDWDFNAWGGLTGGLYFPWDLDDLLARKICDIENLDMYKAPLVLEGGSIHTDGQGTLITTEECLLNSNRNPSMSKNEIETVLKNHLNIQKIIWLPKGVYLDETDGHVDNICCFARPGEVILSWTDDQNDPQYSRSAAAKEMLERTTDAQGRTLKIHRIHQPDPILITKEESIGVDTVEGTLPRLPGDRLAASYVNFYIANYGIVMPVFGDRYDEPAVNTIRKIFPEREIIPVSAREILLGGGNIHCITQQIPEHKNS
jgi:agmatine deiminase